MISIILAVILILLFVVLYVVRAQLVDFNSNFTNAIKTNLERLTELQKFSYDLVLPNPPENIVLSNPYACTLDELHLCNITDPQSCFGCQNLIASCQHFDSDKLYINAMNEHKTIPANTSPDEGYCMVVHTLAERCNQYHGDLVFVQREPGSTETVLLCNCKNPGLVGNTQILGACDTAFVCHGKVDDINQPLNEMSCICAPNQMAVTANGIPSCQVKSVMHASSSDFAALGWPVDSVSSSVMALNIRSNFTGANFRNPCSYCVLTGVPVNSELIYSELYDTYFCRNTDMNALPVRRDPTQRILHGEYGPDGMIALGWHGFNFYGHLLGSTTPTARAAIVIKASLVNEPMRKLLNFERTDGFYYIDAAPHDLAYRFTLHIPTKLTRLPVAYCRTTSSFRYNCRLMSAHVVSSTQVTYMPPDEKNYSMLSRVPQNKPTGFFFGTTQWLTVESLNPMLDTGNNFVVPANLHNHLLYYGGTFSGDDIYMRAMRLMYFQLRVADTEINSVERQCTFRIVRNTDEAAWLKYVQYVAIFERRLSETK